MKRTAKIRLGTFVLAALLLPWGFWMDAHLGRQATQTHLEYVYRRALSDLAGYVTGMQSTLQKAMYAGTASTQSAVSAQLLEQSGGAKAALAALPFSQEKSERVSRFLSQTGDFAMALSRKSFSGKGLEKPDMESLAALREYAGKLAGALTDIQSRLRAEGDHIVQTVSLLNNVTEIDQLALLDDDFDAVAEEFAAIPTLLYDGPFSDHISRRCPAYLQDREGVSREEAAKEAARFLGCDPGELASAGEGGGSLPVWSFTWGDSMVNITRQGGEPAYYKKAGAVETSRLGYSQALAAARKYLDGLGFPAMRESYYVISDNLCAINFHSTAEVAGEEAWCYPDLVKVVVELDQGGAVEFDSTGFLMNHRQRDLDGPRLSREQAEQALSPALRADSGTLAVIPTPGLYEVLCWEFHCTAADGTEVLSYVNAGTGQEEQLYILRRDGHGVLAQ